MRKENRQKGFTLVEMIAALVLAGILSALAGMGVVAGVQGYLFAKDTASVNEKAQLALMRINRELLECYNCDGSGSLADQPFENTLGTRYIRLTGTNIVLSNASSGGDILMDNVASFSMKYNTDTSPPDKSIDISFTSSVKPGDSNVPAFTSRVYPRNIR
jgi:prepilin-type N-terminal cleavage/methylation domain-containing protein